MQDEKMIENPVKTAVDLMADIGKHEAIQAPENLDLTKSHIVTLPNHRKVQDLTELHRKALETVRPFQRKGTARLQDLSSLVLWANRFKSPDSILFADPNADHPSLTCVADYHLGGPPSVDPTEGDKTARHCQHRAHYDFPLSDEWKAWNKISGEPLAKDEMGEFIEAQAKDIMDPTPAIIKGAENEKNQKWENRLIETARQIEGKYGQLSKLLAMSKQFQVYESSDLKVSTNRDTGEAEIQFLNEHKSADGKALDIPNLIIVTIPVFEGGAAYRMPVRFRYRKNGAKISFIMTLYNPEKAFKDAFQEAVTTAKTETNLPCLIGKPEA